MPSTHCQDCTCQQEQNVVNLRFSFEKCFCRNSRKIEALIMHVQGHVEIYEK